jgi:hypothetical protein
MLSAKEIANRERTRRNVRKETYRAILEQLCRKIRSNCDKGQRSAYLEVPPFVLGYPPFNVAQAVEYIVRQLERLGYQVYRRGLIHLEVTWIVKHYKKIEVIDNEVLPAFANLQKTANSLRNHTSR